MDIDSSIQESTQRPTQVGGKLAGFNNNAEALMSATDIFMSQAKAIVEQEYKKKLDDKDHEISEKDKKIAEQAKQLKELEALLDKYIPGVEVMRTKLKKYDKTYKELTAENAELEKKLSSASKESVRKKLEISQKLNELDELRRTVDAIPDEVIRAYTAQKYVHHGRMNQEI